MSYHNPKQTKQNKNTPKAELKQETERTHSISHQNAWGSTSFNSTIGPNKLHLRGTFLHVVSLSPTSLADLLGVLLDEVALVPANKTLAVLSRETSPTDDADSSR